MCRATEIKGKIMGLFNCTSHLLKVIILIHPRHFVSNISLKSFIQLTVSGRNVDVNYLEQVMSSV